MATATLPPCDETARPAPFPEPGTAGGTDAPAAPSIPAAEPLHETGTIVATVLGSSLAFVVGSIINVALPSMQRDLGTDAAGAQWIVNAYLLPLGALVLIGGALGDHYGRKRLFQLGLIVFTAGCLGCALSPNLPALLAARVVQGVGAALLAPNSLAIIAASFTGERRGKAVGTWAAAGAIAGAVAPVLGGWIVDTLNWHWAFLVVVPPAAAAWVVARRSVAESVEDPGDAAPLDWTGATAVTLALATLVWALISLPTRGIGDVAVLGALVAGTALAALFARVEHARGDGAMMPLALFTTPAFTGISLLTLLLYAALGGLLVLLPYMLIESFGFGATEAGAALLPMPLIIGTLSRAAGGLAGRVGARPMLIAGPLVVAVGFALLSRVPSEGFDYWTGRASRARHALARHGHERRAADHGGHGQRSRRQGRRRVGGQQRDLARRGARRHGAARVRAGRTRRRRRGRGGGGARVGLRLRRPGRGGARGGERRRGGLAGARRLTRRPPIGIDGSPVPSGPVGDMRAGDRVHAASEPCAGAARAALFRTARDRCPDQTTSETARQAKAPTAAARAMPASTTTPSSRIRPITISVTASPPTVADSGTSSITGIVRPIRTQSSAGA